LALIGKFSPVYIQARLSEQFSGSQAAYRTAFRVTGGYQKAGKNSLKGLLEGVSQLVSDFMISQK
jgi:hypothetical protein